MTAKRKQRKSGYTAARRLAKIESSLKGLERNLNHTKKHMVNLDRAMSGFGDSKQFMQQNPLQGPWASQMSELLSNPAVQSILNQSRNRGSPAPIPQQANRPPGLSEFSEMLKILQNPALQSFMANAFKGPPAKTAATPPGAGDFSQVMQLLNHPLLQSLLKMR